MHRLGIGHGFFNRAKLALRTHRRHEDWVAAKDDLTALIVAHGYPECARILGCHWRHLWRVAKGLGINPPRSVMERCRRAGVALDEKYRWLSDRRAEWLSAVLMAAGIKQFTPVQLRYALQRLRKHPAIPEWFFMYRERLGPILAAGSQWWTLDNNSYVTTMPADPEAVADPRDVKLFGEALEASWTHLPPTASSSG